MSAWHEAFHALCLGRSSAAEVARAIYGRDDEQLVARLAGYRRSMILNEADGLRRQHPQTQATVCALFGFERWVALTDDFLHAHPRMDARRIVSLAPFAGWLCAREDLPAWLGDLATLERVALEVQVAADNAPGPLAPGCSIIAVDHDVLAWNEAGADVERPPAAVATLVLTWRDAELVVRQAEIGPFEQFVVAQLERGLGSASAEQLAEFGLERSDFDEVVEQLRELGVLVQTRVQPAV